MRDRCAVRSRSWLKCLSPRGATPTHRRRASCWVRAGRASWRRWLMLPWVLDADAWPARLVLSRAAFWCDLGVASELPGRAHPVGTPQRSDQHRPDAGTACADFSSPQRAFQPLSSPWRPPGCWPSLPGWHKRPAKACRRAQPAGRYWRLLHQRISVFDALRYPRARFRFPSRSTLLLADSATARGPRHPARLRVSAR